MSGSSLLVLRYSTCSAKEAIVTAMKNLAEMKMTDQDNERLNDKLIDFYMALEHVLAERMDNQIFRMKDVGTGTVGKLIDIMGDLHLEGLFLCAYRTNPKQVLKCYRKLDGLLDRTYNFLREEHVLT